MTSTREELSSKELALLTQIVQAREPDLLPALKGLGKIRLSDEHREAIREVLAAEMCESGLDTNDEPNTYGLEIDDMIGKLILY